jgi:hypothetical protein
MKNGANILKLLRRIETSGLNEQWQKKDGKKSKVIKGTQLRFLT